MKILLLGSTGSIGTSTIHCIRRYPDKFELSGLTANTNTGALIALAREFGVSRVCVGDTQAASIARRELGGGIKVFEGTRGLAELVETADYEVLVNALVGAAGLVPTATALKRNKRVALANKESLVVGGDYITGLLDRGQGTLIPIDSEHSAILQAIGGEQPDTIESMILTASGGPFREYSPEQFMSITPRDALNHPTWSMGAKITIDCATLVNKGFEVIEAHHLFRLPYDKLRICIHPQSIIHSMVEFHDGAVIAQMGLPDMELPIQYALSYPQRLRINGPRLDLATLRTLTFEEPDPRRFPCLKLCLDAGRTGGSAPAAVNAANEIAVKMFLDGRIGFGGIAHTIGEVLDKHIPVPADTLETILDIDKQIRLLATTITERLSK